MVSQVIHNAFLILLSTSSVPSIQLREREVWIWRTIITYNPPSGLDSRHTPTNKVWPRTPPLDPPLNIFSKGEATFQMFSPPSPSQSWYQRVLHIVSLANRCLSCNTCLTTVVCLPKIKGAYFFHSARLTDYMDFYDTYMSNISYI